VTIGGSILLFYRPIKALLSGLNLKKIEGWGVKAEFEKGLDKVERAYIPERNCEMLGRSRGLESPPVASQWGISGRSAYGISTEHWHRWSVRYLKPS
jgi:hypothetical protein